MSVISEFVRMLICGARKKMESNPYRNTHKNIESIATPECLVTLSAVIGWAEGKGRKWLTGGEEREQKESKLLGKTNTGRVNEGKQEGDSKSTGWAGSSDGCSLILKQEERNHQRSRENPLNYYYQSLTCIRLVQCGSTVENGAKSL